MKSIWSENIEIPEREALEGDCRVEVAVIGAGMAGILTAYFLQERGVQVRVLEAKRIGSGQTQNTTAKITGQHGLFYGDLIKKMGEKKAADYAHANEQAIMEYERLIQKHHIACDFERLPAYLYSREEQDALRKEEQAAQRLGIQAYFTDKIELPFAIKGALCFPNQAQFHPLAFLKEIAKDLQIYEQTKVLSVKKNKIYTNRGCVEAEHIVFATHYPIVNVPGMYFARQHQERSYVLALSEAEPLHGMYYSIDKNGLSLRSAGDCLLLGGGAHRTGKEGEAYAYLRQCAKRYYPGKREVASWSAQDCMPHDKVPFIGSYSILRPNWYVATGFHKWGMTSAMVAAGIISDQICGIENPFEKVFRPQRLSLRAFPSFIKDLGESVKGLSKGAFHFPFLEIEDLEKGQGCVVRIGHKRYACYKDESGHLHKISAKCPHMGCELQWNAEETSWDCPCHGSRFDFDGNLLDNPAQVDKSCEND